MIRLDIVTPEKKAFSDEVDGVVIPAKEGEMGVLENHAPLVTTLAPGELRYSKGGKEVSLAIGEGIVEVTRHSVAVLTDMAMGEGEIDEDAVEKALESAEKALAEKGANEDPEQMAIMMATIQRQMAQLHVKRKRRSI